MTGKIASATRRFYGPDFAEPCPFPEGDVKDSKINDEAAEQYLQGT